MLASYGLPTHRVDRPDDFLTASAVSELARAAEAAGFAAVYTTEHPFPPDAWLAGGGHHAIDPLIALSFAAAATTTVRLHTNLFVLALRNPFLAAKSIASLDVLSAGRVILGIGAGYLEREFEAVGASFPDRNRLTDEGIAAIRAAWSGERFTFTGSGYAASGNAMLPRPLQTPHPPIWVGGNSRQAIRRAVELADGWSPFPASGRLAQRTRTAAIRDVEDLASSLDYARSHAERVGRDGPLTVVFVPEGLSMVDREPLDTERVIDSVKALEAIGVDWITVALPGLRLDDQLAAIDEFGSTVLRHVTPPATS